MKIAVYSHYFVPEIGAPSARIHDLSREWLRSGNDVQVVTCFPNHPTGVIYPGYDRRGYQREVVDGIQVHRTWSYITPNKGFVKKTIGHVSFMPSSIVTTWRHVDPFDIVIGTSPTFFAAMAAARVARSRRRPFVMEVRDLWPAVFVELGVLKNRLLIAALEKLELGLYRQAARVVTVTESFRQNLIERGVPAHKVKTIPNGADLDFWTGGDAAGLRARLGLTNETVALYIGAHGISQALSAILAAAGRLRDRKDIVFLFVGEGAEKEMLKERARAAGLQNVRFHDPVGKNEVRDFYAMADIGLVPLRNIPLFDTFIPSKMFEILAMETPVLGSVRGEAAEILRASGGAEVVSPEDDQAIAGAIVALASDPARREEMGRRGRAYVAAHYSRHALAGAYLEVMREAVEEAGAARR